VLPSQFESALPNILLDAAPIDVAHRWDAGGRRFILSDHASMLLSYLEDFPNSR
jgi:hypothetical protein